MGHVINILNRRKLLTMTLASSSSFVIPTRASIPLSLLLLVQFAFFVGAFLSPELHQPTRSQTSKKQDASKLSSWSKIAEFDADLSSFRLIETKDECLESSNYSLASPREWLEYCEATQRKSVRYDEEQDSSDDRFGGAYTVLRCDLRLDKEESWNIWGKDFHFQRLEESFRMLLSRAGFTNAAADDEESKFIELALDASQTAMNLLLHEAKVAILNNIHEKEKEPSTIITVMLTLLWEIDYTTNLIRENDNIPIRVRGHAFSTMKVSRLQNNDPSGNNEMGLLSNPNAPVQVVLGHLPPSVHEEIRNRQDSSNSTFSSTGTSSLKSLPNRYQNAPQAKLSSWCRKRRPLEETFKICKEVGDVILNKGQEELLEGLTSNVFVVYPGKTLKTAKTEDVLGGYVRHQILECAQDCGYTVDYGPISVREAHLWEEVFLTSSIRLIIPVDKVLLPVETDDDTKLFELETVWELQNDEDTNHDCKSSTPPPASDVLYAELVKQQERQQQ